ncbi:uncharacterized protein UDID_18448 [Ustilago sp. UG-2017a]|nr:uncharacterized protein UDID_18448 [Ustilago sp. UG-2017a]
MQTVGTWTMNEMRSHPLVHSSPGSSSERSDGPCSKNSTVHRYNGHNRLFARWKFKITFSNDDIRPTDKLCERSRKVQLFTPPKKRLHPETKLCGGVVGMCAGELLICYPRPPNIAAGASGRGGGGGQVGRYVGEYIS